MNENDTALLSAAAVYWLMIAVTYIMLTLFYWKVMKIQKRNEEQLEFLRSQLILQQSPVRITIPDTV